MGPEVAGEGEVRIVEVPGFARVAALRFKGPYAELERAYDWLYGAGCRAAGRSRRMRRSWRNTSMIAGRCRRRNG